MELEDREELLRELRSLRAEREVLLTSGPAGRGLGAPLLSDDAGEEQAAEIARLTKRIAEVEAAIDRAPPL